MLLTYVNKNNIFCGIKNIKDQILTSVVDNVAVKANNNLLTSCLQITVHSVT